jgi:putative resolvase
MKLSQYAQKIGVTYKTAYRMFKRDELDAYQLPTALSLSMSQWLAANK